MTMTGLETVALISSTITIGQALSKLFLPPEAIEPDVNMEYEADSSGILYSATFTLPKYKRLSFFNKKKPCMELKCKEGFLLMKSHLDIGVDYKEVTVPSLHCCIPSVIGEENIKTLSGRRVNLTLEVNIDLEHRIHTNEPRLAPNSNHMKCSVTNTLDIPVRNYQFKIHMPNNRKLIEALLIDDGIPKTTPVILNRRVALSCTTGKLLQDFPTINTADSSWVNDERNDTSTEIVVPIDHIEANHELIVDLIFNQKED